MAFQQRLFSRFGVRAKWRRTLGWVLGGAALIALLLSVSAFSPNAPEWTAHPPIHVLRSASSTYQTGYAPAQIRMAYGFNNLSGNGSGVTIAIVDAYGSPTIQKDLPAFCKQFGLTAASLTVVNLGKFNRVNAGWALETSLDVEWAHAIAPGARILLVAARSSSLSDLITAVDYATSHGASVVSMSWGGSEFSSEATYDTHFSNAKITYLASSGDSGAGVEWPAVSTYVVGVGGTSLKTNADGSYFSETAWSGSGGGESTYVSEPSYQTGWQSTLKRGVPDVAFVADPGTGVAVYDSTPYSGQSGWFVVGGTSVGAPCWAGLFALVTSSGDSPLYSAATKTYATDYHDITTGSNGFAAGPGYDFVTGLGSPVANNLVPTLGGK